MGVPTRSPSATAKSQAHNVCCRHDGALALARPSAGSSWRLLHIIHSDAAVYAVVFIAGMITPED